MKINDKELLGKLKELEQDIDIDIYQSLYDSNMRFGNSEFVPRDVVSSILQSLRKQVFDILYR